MKWTSDVESIESHVAGHSARCALLVDDRDRAIIVGSNRGD